MFWCGCSRSCWSVKDWRRSNANISSQNVPNPQVLLWFPSGLKSLMMQMTKILQLWIFLKLPTRFVHLSAICCHQAFLRDLEWGRQQQPSFWKRLHFRRVEMGVRKTLQILEKDCPPPSVWQVKTGSCRASNASGTAQTETARLKYAAAAHKSRNQPSSTSSTVRMRWHMSEMKENLNKCCKKKLVLGKLKCWIRLHLLYCIF